VKIANLTQGHISVNTERNNKMSELDHRANTHFDNCKHWKNKECNCRMTESSKELADLHKDNARLQKAVDEAEKVIYHVTLCDENDVEFQGEKLYKWLKEYGKETK